MRMTQKHETKQQKIFIGVSWPYASGNIHIGHLAGQYVVCDVFARYHRLVGNKVLMVSGSDSHGTPIVYEAEKQGITPTQLVQKSHELITETYTKLGFLYENYTSTTTENHKKVVQNVFSTLLELGYLETRETEQYYDETVKRFLPDRYVRGTCPLCKTENARGDECPACGAFLEPDQLIDPYSTLSNTKPIKKKTTHYFLDLKRTDSELREWLKDKEYWREWVKEFTKGFIAGGLKPRSVTRDMTWGVKVPLQGWEDKVIYVWIEAVVGYLSAAIEWAQKNGNPSEWEDFWKDEKCKHYYFIAGGNVPFHTIIWPAELIAYSEKYNDAKLFEKYKLPGEILQKKLNLPYDVPANKMLLFKGVKMSKGDHHNISVTQLLDKYNPDLLRYFFIKYAPENHDRDFKWKDLIDANNNELVANIGNFVNRTISFVNTKFDGKVPSGKLDKDVQNAINDTFKTTAEELENCHFTKAMESILELGHFANKYFNDGKPWETIKKEYNKSANTLYNSIQIVSAFITLLAPFLPFSANKIANLLNVSMDFDPNILLANNQKITQYTNNWQPISIESQTAINPALVLFDKLEYDEELQKIDNVEETDEQLEKIEKIQLTKDKQLEKIPTLFTVYRNIKIKKKDAYVQKWLDEMVKNILEVHKEQNWDKSPTFTGFIRLHNQYSNQKDLISSSQSLVKDIKEQGYIQNINTFVDIYNAISALTGVSIGVHDINEIEGDPRLTILEKDQDFTIIGGKDKATAYKDEYAYVDNKGILCRLDIKQSNRTKISEKSKNIFVIFQGHDSLGEGVLETSRKMLDEAINRFLNS